MSQFSLGVCDEVEAMNGTLKTRILVVDDEPNLRDTTAMILNASNYEASTAFDGFNALEKIRLAAPDLIICDLNMPRMSGFELLRVVRHRFPMIRLIAISAATEFAGHTIGELVVDGFYQKGRCDPEELLRIVSDLVQSEPAHLSTTDDIAPEPTQRNAIEAKPQKSKILTCTDCLRSFPLSVPPTSSQQIQEVPCVFCSTPILYIAEEAPFAPHQQLPVVTALALRFA
jgi:CheY-like chemotaxis protein